MQNILLFFSNGVQLELEISHQIVFYTIIITANHPKRIISSQWLAWISYQFAYNKGHAYGFQIQNVEFINNKTMIGIA